MRACLGVLALLLAGTAFDARACTDGRNMRFYFSRTIPTADPGNLVLQVRVSAVVRGGATARLEDRYAEIVGQRFATIEFPKVPDGANCVDVGPTDGPVFVAVRTLVVSEKTGIRMVAVPNRSKPIPLRRPSDVERYIVDPAYLRTSP